MVCFAENCLPLHNTYLIMTINIEKPTIIILHEADIKSYHFSHKWCVLLKIVYHYTIYT